jgi:hypothetical protein
MAAIRRAQAVEHAGARLPSRHKTAAHREPGRSLRQKAEIAYACA